MKSKKIPIRQAIDQIVTINRGLAAFWNSAYGWASTDAANLLSKSRLDRQVSLSACLRMWSRRPKPGQEDGFLILAWTNLGTLVEGSMKFFLCVFLHDYAKNPLLGRQNDPVEPDGLLLEVLRQFFMKNVWTDGEKRLWGPFVAMVQQRRNGIHAFRDRDIGDRNEFHDAVRMYLEFVESISRAVPYPDPSDRR